MANNTLDNYLCGLIDQCETLQELDDFVLLWGIDKNNSVVVKRRGLLA